MTRIKICGNTNIEDAVLAAELGADYLGFIFAESKRRIDTATASRIISELPHFKNFVGVFVNESKQAVEKIADQLGLNFLQFHGDETALYCQHFMSRKFNVIKAFRVKDAMSLKRIDEYDVSAFLLDAYSSETRGGSGKTFDWNLVNTRPHIREKLFLAGGLNPENVQQAVKTIRPYALDVASGVEKSPGKKDPRLLRKFFEQTRQGSLKNVSKGTVRP